MNNCTYKYEWDNRLCGLTGSIVFSKGQKVITCDNHYSEALQSYKKFKKEVLNKWDKKIVEMT